MFRNNLITTFRFFLKYKGYSFVNILGLAIGLATCILIFLFVQYETSYDKFHDNAGRIYRIEPFNSGLGEESHWAASQGNIIPALSSRYAEIESSVKIHYSFMTAVVSYEGNLFRESGIVYGDSTFFDVFSFKLLRGNPATALSGPEKIIISETAAQRYFGKQDPMGKFLKSDTRSYLVTGIMEDIPNHSHLKFDLLISMDDLRSRWPTLDDTGPSTFYSYVKLYPGTDAQQLIEKVDQDVWDILGYTVSGDSANIPEGFQARLLFNPITDIHLKGHAEKELASNGNIQYIYIFSIVALFVLIIACINYMNLATARSSTRSKEIGVRKVLGANRGSIFNQFISESFLMTFIALLLALLFVELLLPVFNSLTGQELKMQLFNNPQLIYSLAAIWLFVGLFSGSYPALYLSKFNPLKVIYASNSHGTSGKTAIHLRRSLVVFQFAISILLIIGVITVNKQLNFIQAKKLGFNKEQVVVIPFAGRLINDKVEVFKNKLTNNPSVVSASASNSIPGKRIHLLPFRFPELLEGNLEQNEEGDDYVGMRTLSTDLDVISTFGLEVVEGRGFSPEQPGDANTGFVINQAAAEELNLENTVGSRVEYDWGLETPKKGKVIGVVRNFHYASLHTEVEPLIIHVMPDHNRFLSVRLHTLDIIKSVKELEEAWTFAFPTIPFEYFFLDSFYDSMYKTETSMSSIIFYFTVLAIIIACLGLFGLASYMTEQRTKEIGIRKVLGASISKIVATLSKEFIVLVVLSNLIAWLPAWYFLNQWLNTFIYRTGLNWWLFLVSGILSMIIALLVVGLQTYLAGRMNPVDSIKSE